MPRIVNRDQRRREIALAVYRVIDRAGLEGASMREIAREAGCTTGALTHYFTDRGDLLEFALGLATEEPMRRVVATAATGDLAEALAELLPLDERRRLEGMAWLASIRAAQQDARLAAGLSERCESATALLAQTLERQLAADDRHPGEQEISMLADEIVTAMDGIAVYGLSEPERYPPARQRALVERVLLRTGLRGPQEERG